MVIAVGGVLSPAMATFQHKTGNTATIPNKRTPREITFFIIITKASTVRKPSHPNYLFTEGHPDSVFAKLKYLLIKF
jgi:hypothetical protein